MRKAAIHADQAQPEVEDKRTEKKALEIVMDDNTGLYRIKWNNGGEVPDALKGMWTNIFRAQNAIDNFSTAEGS